MLYWAEPHSKDVLLIDYTSLTSHKTKAEKPNVCVCVWLCGKMEKADTNTLIFCCGSKVV